MSVVRSFQIARNAKKPDTWRHYTQAKKLKNVRWGAALGGALAAEAAVVASASEWVAIYSYLLYPGESPAFYEQYARMASPWVALLAGTPVFYLACRWIGSRRPTQAWPTAIGIFGIYSLVDAPFVLLGDNPALPYWLVAINYLAKFMACYFGGASAARSAVEQSTCSTTGRRSSRYWSTSRPTWKGILVLRL
jgi:hypothetical protein